MYIIITIVWLRLIFLRTNEMEVKDHFGTWEASMAVLAWVLQNVDEQLPIACSQAVPSVKV